MINNNFSRFLNFINFCKENKVLFNSLLSETSNTDISFYKKGNKIHIKKKNRGSFTRYCGGNVTEECIRKGKASPNPAIRKKATFAANARRFKHKFGGSIKLNLEQKLIKLGIYGK